jgi:hypothetical protein
MHFYEIGFSTFIDKYHKIPYILAPYETLYKIEYCCDSRAIGERVNDSQWAILFSLSLIHNITFTIQEKLGIIRQRNVSGYVENDEAAAILR